MPLSTTPAPDKVSAPPSMTPMRGGWKPARSVIVGSGELELMLMCSCPMIASEKMEDTLNDETGQSVDARAVGLDMLISMSPSTASISERLQLSSSV